MEEVTQDRVNVFLKLPSEVHEQLVARAKANHRTIKSEAEYIIELAVMADGTGVPCVGNRTTKQEG
jgi:plasmid stability protein